MVRAKLSAEIRRELARISRVCVPVISTGPERPGATCCAYRPLKGAAMKRVFVGARGRAGRRRFATSEQCRTAGPVRGSSGRSHLHQGHRAHRASSTAPRAIGRAKSRRCRCSRTTTCGRGRARSRQGRRAARCRRGARTPSQSLKMRNDPSLSKEQIDTIVAWVDGGAPRGNDADMPPAPTFADGLDARHASRTTSSRCRSSSTSLPKASSACRCSIRRFHSRKIASPRSLELRPGNRARRASRGHLRRRYSRRHAPSSTDG